MSTLFIETILTFPKTVLCREAKDIYFGGSKIAEYKSSLFFYFCNFYWDVINMQYHTGLRCTTQWFDICIIAVITTTSLVNTHRLIYLNFFLMIRTVKVYSLSNFQIHNTVLLTVVTILCVRPPELAYLYNWKLVPLKDWGTIDV